MRKSLHGLLVACLLAVLVLPMLMFNTPSVSADYPSKGVDYLHRGVADVENEFGEFGFALLWKDNILSMAGEFSGPIAVGNKVWSANKGDNIFRCLELKTGSLIWSYQLNTGTDGASLWFDNKNYVATGCGASPEEGNLYAFNADNGDLLWQRNGINNTGYGAGPWINPDNRIIYWRDGLYLRAMNADNGDLIWSTNTGQNVGPYTGVYYNGITYTPQLIRAYNAENGDFLWSISGTVWDSGITVDNENVDNVVLYVGRSWPAEVWCINPDNGDIYWVRQISAGSVLNLPAVWENKIYSGGCAEDADNYNIFCLRKDNGDYVWGDIESNASIVTSQTILPSGKIIYANDVGYLKVRDANNGTLLWQYEIGKMDAGHVAVVDNYVLVNSETGYLWCFESGAGSGTPADPYIITNVGQLQEMRDNLSAYYALGNDIDASDTKNWNDNGDGGYYGFEPIGTYASNFTGSFDGQGYKITNLYINRPSTDYVGLFGGSGGIVENVEMIDVDMNGYGGVGGLVGTNFGTVSNCYSTGSVSGYTEVGGLVGGNITGTIFNSYSTCFMNGVAGVGGLIGYNTSIVSNSYSTGLVNGTDDVGGLIGIDDGGIMSNCYSTSSVVGSAGVGGFTGGNAGIISNCYSIGSVNGTNFIGGLIGYNSGTVTNCYSTGSASGTGGYTGGLVGKNDAGTISNSFWDNETSGQSTSTGGTGKTTENMKDVRTFTDNTWSVGLTAPWDVVGNPYEDENNTDIWDIHPLVNDGYPFLAWAFVPPVSQPQLVSPENGITIADNTPTFVWGKGAHADSHSLLVDNDNDFSTPNENRILFDNTYTIADEDSLVDGIYYWKVVAINAAGENESDVWWFKVNTPPVCTTLKTEGQVDPTKLTTFTPTMSWNYSDSDNDNQVQFQVQVGTAENDNSMWDNAGAALTQITYSGSTLSRGVTYYVRVRVKDNYEWSTWANGTFKLSQSPTVTVGDSTIELKLVEAGDAPVITTSTFTIKLTVGTRTENLLIYYAFVEETPSIQTDGIAAPFYFSISTANPGAITAATITFNIPKSWVQANNIVLSSLTVWRSTDGTWQTLPTALVGEDVTYYYLEATTTGFSLFCVTGQKKAVAPSETPMAAPTPQTSPSDQQMQQVVFIAALGILIVVVMLLASSYMRHKKRK